MPLDIKNDEPFIRNVEGLINPGDSSDLFFFASFRRWLPTALFKRILYRTARQFPHIGFVIEPYCLFLFFKIKDVAQAQAALPSRFQLAKAKVFDADAPEYYYGMGIFGTRASTFCGARLESYLIAKDTVTGNTSWIFSDILSNTLIATPKKGITAPNCRTAVHTTNSKGEIFIDFRQNNSDRKLSMKGNLTNAQMRPLEQDLWIMGNTSIGHTKELSDGHDEPFAVIFDPAEVKQALDVPVQNLTMLANTLLPAWVDPAIGKSACFPFAQHYIADSPGCGTPVANPEDMVAQYHRIAALVDPKTFSAQPIKRQFVFGLALPVLACIILTILLLQKGM